VVPLGISMLWNVGRRTSREKEDDSRSRSFRVTKKAMANATIRKREVGEWLENGAGLSILYQPC